jgi:WD40 repeat protein
MVSDVEFALPYAPAHRLPLTHHRPTAITSCVLLLLLAALGGSWWLEAVWHQQCDGISREAEEFAQRTRYRVRALAVSPDRSVVACGVLGGVVSFWDPLSGLVAAAPLEQVHGVRALAFSPDGLWLAAAGGDSARLNGELRIWNWQTGELLNDLAFTGVCLEHVTFSPDGRYLAAAGSDGCVRIWGTPGLHLEATLPVSDNPLTATVFSPDGETFAAATDDGYVSLRSTIDWQRAQTFKAHEGVVWSLAFSPDGQRLASTGEGGQVCLWDTSNPICPRELGHMEGHGRCLAFSADGRYLAVAGGSVGCPGELRCWDVSSGELVSTPRGHADVIYGLAWTTNDTVVTGSADQSMRVWDPRSPEMRRVIKLPGG